MIYNIYIFNKDGTCIYYEDWNKKKQSQNQSEDQKLLFGMLYSLKAFITSSSPKKIDDKTGFHCYKTSTYKLHYYETLSCIKFIIMSDPNVPDLRDDLKKIYSQIFVEYVIKNPIYKHGTTVKCDTFINQLNLYLKQMPSFSS
ncbi:hypothetical protein ACTFIW_011982 [Dictyostelium discoideum]|uniref:Trafficking protein particle complex subunit 1 n=1 Tax=Dictyostelium discoideum TaxID=44689 RepID=TPPC1_DICDI|nr:hypothetical protein DDB_G0273467 [Dictyostelium discoideum AX4]XP_644672.1 hypothetical protein DDB_G0273579 [Dictyostelium discoideum AX4]Q557G3.1 RecName: Full=Trafficking protein particle complex subunit 1 [Dictyostelium discoideum]EAL70688.1 hypothetical protein DDB_G0273467 [Dictyostelium discoideum AX4]EAL70744.1 hypothetical protein DDB_G0273579 [Dictyostelium discoideum AX4]|eukprot:XP_644579.1 hypothetical protein DDB_G0273467 [Dictyostelium discoideum AX4]